MFKPGGHKALPYIGFKAFSVGAGFISARYLICCII
jgi:hypothetical protein